MSNAPPTDLDQQEVRNKKRDRPVQYRGTWYVRRYIENFGEVQHVIRASFSSSRKGESDDENCNAAGSNKMAMAT